MKSSTQIQVEWKDKSDNEQGFKVERSDDKINWSELPAVAAGETSHIDDGLNPQTRYYYRVCASNADGDSGYTYAGAKTTSSGNVPQIVDAEVLPSGYKKQYGWTTPSANAPVHFHFTLSKAAKKLKFKLKKKLGAFVSFRLLDSDGNEVGDEVGPYFPNFKKKIKLPKPGKQGGAGSFSIKGLDAGTYCLELTTAAASSEVFDKAMLQYKAAK